MTNKNSSFLMESLFPEDKDGERIASDVKECFQYIDKKDTVQSTIFQDFISTTRYTCNTSRSTETEPNLKNKMAATRAINLIFN